MNDSLGEGKVGRDASSATSGVPDGDGIRTFTDALGGVTTIIPPNIARQQRRLRELLTPDHACTGSGGIGQHADGNEVIAKFATVAAATGERSELPVTPSIRNHEQPGSAETNDA